MKIEFKKIKFQNLLSYGEPTEFIFKNGIDLIIGKNGRGKSTIPDAITFALFGKPFRKIKMGSLVNNKTKKKMLCELDFTIIKGDKKTDYRIVRGLNPQIFEIYKLENESYVKVDQHSNTRDYQKFLEENILKISDNVFRQLIVLGANLSSSKSFMDLNSKEKEEILQVITDTSVFIQLSDSIREKKLNLKNQVSDLKKDVLNMEFNINTTKNNIITMENQKSEFIKNRDSTIQNFKMQIEETENNLSQLKQQFSEAKTQGTEKIELKIAELEQKIEKYSRAKNKLISDDNLFDYKINQFIQNEENKIICPSCNCEIKEKLDYNIYDIKKEKEECLTKLNKIETLIQDTQKELNVHQRYLGETKLYISNLDNSIKNSELNLIKLNEQLINTTNWEPPEIDYTQLDELKSKDSKLKEKLSKLEHDENDYIELENLLGEESLKGLILNQQLPILNKFINEFLELFESKYNFVIDNHLKDTIISRGSEAEFNALSNGQKQRITVAILFSFLRLIEEKNGVSTNLLILDEYLDSSLDELGVSEVLKILYDKFSSNKNILLISHNPDIKSKIEFIQRNFLVKLENGFSKLKEIKL